MKKHFLTIGLLTAIALGALSLRADTNTVAAATNAPAAAGTNAVAAAAPTPASTNAPSVEQRLESIEAYFQNGDPTAPYKDTNSNWTVNFALGPSIINTNLFNSTAPGAFVSYPGAGHNAWLLTSTALVLFMTLPGLALFYGGMVRKKNVLSVLAQCFLITGLVTILWVFVGYGMIFGGTGNDTSDPVKRLADMHSEDWVAGWVGNPGVCWLMKNVTSAPNGNYSYWVSENVYAMFQLMFAVITPALIIGSIAERMKFKAIFVFMTLWMLIVYFTQGHMVWGVNGIMNGCWNADAKIHGLDFAGAAPAEGRRFVVFLRGKTSDARLEIRKLDDDETLKFLRPLHDLEFAAAGQNLAAIFGDDRRHAIGVFFVFDRIVDLGTGDPIGRHVWLTPRRGVRR